MDAARSALRVDVDKEIEPEPARGSIAKSDHFAEFPAGIDVEERKRRLGRKERLARQMQHDARILADRIEHHRVAELRHHLAHDADRFGFETLQMTGAQTRGRGRIGNDGQSTSFAAWGPNTATREKLTKRQAQAAAVPRL